MKIGAITIGQAPRTDVTADILHIFDDSLELVQAGGLDGLTKEQIAEFAPGKDDYVLVSRLTDGSSEHLQSVIFCQDFKMQLTVWKMRDAVLL